MKKLQFQIDYENTKVSMEIEPHQKIKLIKKNFDKMFYPVHKEIRLYHKNKDISAYENMQIGDLFKNKIKIPLKASPERLLKSEKYINVNQFENKYYCKCGSSAVILFCRKCLEFECVGCQIKNVNINVFIF